MNQRSLLDGLRDHTVVVADTSDLGLLASLGARDATTNPSLVLKAAAQPAHAGLVSRAVLDTPYAGGAYETWAEQVIERLLVSFGCEILDIIPGRVSTETPARLSFDSAAIVASGLDLIAGYAAAGIPRERVLIKIAATFEGIEAARVLEREGIHCNLTLLFSLVQAVACAEAGVTLISPFVGRILDWYKAQQPAAVDPDPGVASVRRIHHYFKAHGHATEVMGASFRSAAQVLALAGCDLLTISPAILEELATTEGTVPRMLAALDGAPLPERILTDQASFRWQLNEDQMASDKLAEGIRLFHADGLKLAQLVLARGRELGVVN